MFRFFSVKDRFGDDFEAENSSSDEEPEDEFAAEITPNVEEKFLKALAFLKSGDPKIYDEKSKFFDEETEGKVPTNSNGKVKAPQLFLKDYERKVILEKKGYKNNFLFYFLCFEIFYFRKYVDEDENEEENEGNEFDSSLPYAKQQEKLKESFKLILDEKKNDEKNSESFLKIRKKTKEEKVKFHYFVKILKKFEKFERKKKKLIIWNGCATKKQKSQKMRKIW